MTAPPPTIAVAAAPFPPPPLNDTVGAVVYPEPPFVTITQPTDELLVVQPLALTLVGVTIYRTHLDRFEAWYQSHGADIRASVAGLDTAMAGVEGDTAWVRLEGK